MSSPTSIWAGGQSSLSEATCEGHLTVILVLVVGARPINNFTSRVMLGTARPGAMIDTCSVHIESAILDAVVAEQRGVSSGVDE